MCWVPTLLGAAMLAGGTVLLITFWRGRGANAPEVAAPARVESMILGALLTSIGTLVFVLGLTGVICTALGIT